MDGQRTTELIDFKKKRFHLIFKKYTLLPRSLKIISTSKIGPNCCKRKKYIKKGNLKKMQMKTYPKHSSQVWISKPKRYI